MLATIGFILPAAVLMLFFAWGYAHIAHLPGGAAGVLGIALMRRQDDAPR